MTEYVKKTFPCLEITGNTAYLRGQEYGKRLQEPIHSGIDQYLAFFSRRYGWTESETLHAAASCIPDIQVHLPELLEAAEGIAAGAGVSLERIMLLNSRYEMTKQPVPHECTTAAVLPEASANGHTYLIKNWDYQPGILEHIVLVKILKPDGTRIFGITEAGQFLRDGFNSCGFGICSNSISSLQDGKHAGIPVTFLRHAYLNQTDFQTARDQFIRLPRGVSNHSILADRTAGAVGLECLPDFTGQYSPIAGILSHANHLVTVPWLEADKSEPKFRDVRLQFLLQRKRGSIDVPYIQNCLCDHAEYPYSVCCHENYPGQDPMEGYMTVASMIFDLDEENAWVCYGNPCIGRYTAYPLSGL